MMEIRSHRLMQVLITCMSLIFINMPCWSQKEDYNMLWGGLKRDRQPPGAHLAILDFNGGERNLSLVKSEWAFLPDQNNGVISSREGDLLFYSNGCFVTSHNHEMMENGDDINIGEIYPLVSNCEVGYTLRNMMVLPDPAYDEGYYLLHKRIEFLPNTQQPGIITIGTPALMYSYIDMSTNGGLGRVEEKNVEVFRRKDVQLNSGQMHAVRHSNGRDWWVMQVLDTSNVYYAVLIDDGGIRLQDSTVIGPKLHFDLSSSGALKFSPQGDRMVMTGYHDGVMLFDFDRSTGKLSNLRQGKGWDIQIRIGVEWSASGRYMYVSNGDSLWQYDSNASDLDAGRVLIGVWDGSNDPFQTRFGFMQRGPDCRIYMSSYSSTYTIHVINKPDEPGEACDFRQHGLELGISTRSISIPNFPNFRIDTGPVCDPDIVTSVVHPVYSPVERMSLYPNPAAEYVQMNLPPGASGSGTFTLYDMEGRLVYSRYISAGEPVPLGTIPAGLYIAGFVSVEGYAYRGKLVKM